VIDNTLRGLLRVGLRPVRCALVLLFAASIGPPAKAHLQPTTLVALEIGQDRVAMKLHSVKRTGTRLGPQRQPTARTDDSDMGSSLPQVRDPAYSSAHPQGKSWEVQVHMALMAAKPDNWYPDLIEDNHFVYQPYQPRTGINSPRTSLTKP
jgi:hypothetical protein